jgi:hypothetical protein
MWRGMYKYFIIGFPRAKGNTITTVSTFVISSGLMPRHSINFWDKQCVLTLKQNNEIMFCVSYCLEDFVHTCFLITLNDHIELIDTVIIHLGSKYSHNIFFPCFHSLTERFSVYSFFLNSRFGYYLKNINFPQHLAIWGNCAYMISLLDLGFCGQQIFLKLRHPSRYLKLRYFCSFAYFFNNQI